jgi:hypothetical protein
MMGFMSKFQSKRLVVSRVVDASLVMSIAFWLLTKPSYAYLDPGTGSYLFQMAIAGLFGALFAVKQFWQQIKTFVTVKVFHRSESAS